MSQAALLKFSLYLYFTCICVLFYFVLFNSFFYVGYVLIALVFAVVVVLIESFPLPAFLPVIFIL